MRAIVIRHYKTQLNHQNRILGWEDSPPVQDSEVDIDFIDARLRDNGIVIDCVISSDLERSRNTAMIYAERLGISFGNGAGELNEINYGKLQKQRKSWAAKYYPQHKKNPDLVYPEGESFRQMQKRSVDFLSSLATAHARQTALVVIHAGVIRGFVSHYLELEYAHNLEQTIPFRYIGDFVFDGPNCLRYDELGEPSGFVRNKVVDIPVSLPAD